MPIDLPTTFQPLRQQLLAAAQEFASDAQPLAEILAGLVDDVERAANEPLEIVPVCHHSPSSAVHMVRRLRTKAPRIIFMECCEDLIGVLEGLRECTLPVALQAFASQADAFPTPWAPLSLVCPLTEFSAEFQAIAFALENEGTDLVFVDRSADHVFQWMPQTDEALEEAMPDDRESDDDDTGMHGAAVGVEIGSLVPSFEQFTRFLLKNARVQHFSEWYDQYVEESIIGGDYTTYRQVMFLVGSLFRRLGTRAEHRENDELRERYMWTRIKEQLRERQVDPSDAIYICGAAHSASRVEQFGAANDRLWEIPPRTETSWLYGILPSSYGSIEYQFSHPRGAVTIAETRWKKTLRRQKTKAFALTSSKQAKKAAGQSKRASGTKSSSTSNSASHAATMASDEVPHPLIGYLQKPPKHLEEDEAELLQNAVSIVKLARKNGYLATTADSIAVYQTAILLANMRNRPHPTPYDFRDAAITCIEKESVPKKRDVARLCDMLLGGDRTGRIGYDSLPPLARDVYDRLAPLPIKLDARTIQRALLDFRKQPELLPCSDLLWKLRYLLQQDVIRPIMGQRELGHVPVQESWDVAIGKHQGAVIQLGYEGVTVEHVLERRLKKDAFGSEARTVTALRAAEDSILFLKSARLTEELGQRATDLLVHEPDVKDAGEVYKRITRLVHYYRTQPGELPHWCQRFVTTGYSHYATLLPNAFQDRGVTPEDLASMLQFIFTLESLALSLGSERSQLVIAIRQSSDVTADLPKLALLWSAECVLALRDVASLRDRFERIIDNELTIPTLPEYLAGFLLALSFTPLITSLTVELMSKAFERLPDRILMPWLPRLIMTLRPHADTALPTLIKEAAAHFPKDLAALGDWQPPWERPSAARPAKESGMDAIITPAAHAASRLLRQHRATTEAVTSALGLSATWTDMDQPPAEVPAALAESPPGEACQLIAAYPATAQALAVLVAGDSD
jgi:hypothetical protein